MALLEVYKTLVGEPIFSTSLSFLKREHHAEIKLVAETAITNLYYIEGDKIPTGDTKIDIIVRELIARSGVVTIEIRKV